MPLPGLEEVVVLLVLLVQGPDPLHHSFVEGIPLQLGLEPFELRGHSVQLPVEFEVFVVIGLNQLLVFALFH